MPNPRTGAPHSGAAARRGRSPASSRCWPPSLSTPALASSPPSGRGRRDPHPGGQEARQPRRPRPARAGPRPEGALAPTRPPAERPDATMALRNLWLLKDALSPADRAAADKLAARPSKPAVVGNANILVHYDPAELARRLHADQALDEPRLRLRHLRRLRLPPAQVRRHQGRRRPRSTSTSTRSSPASTATAPPTRRGSSSPATTTCGPTACSTTTTPASRRTPRCRTSR